jgi:hypothetical protein
MDPDFERAAVEELVECAEHWKSAPIAEEPSVIHTIDQIAARIMDDLDTAGMTESERITFGLGFLLCSQQLHGQIEDWGMHEPGSDGLALCESIGLISGTVARKVTEPPGREG